MADGPSMIEWIVWLVACAAASVAGTIASLRRDRRCLLRQLSTEWQNGWNLRAEGMLVGHVGVHMRRWVKLGYVEAMPIDNLYLGGGLYETDTVYRLTPTGERYRRETLGLKG